MTCRHFDNCTECRERHNRACLDGDHWRGQAKQSGSLREEIAAKLGVEKLTGDEQFEAALKRINDLLEKEQAHAP
mgnify:CR=1 FL=1